MKNPYYLVVDFEATCSEDESVPRHRMEIIEIGAVMADGGTLQSAGEFQSFVKPVRTPLLTTFCTSLTSIEQTDVDNAPIFPLVAKEFSEWAQSFGDFVFCSWGAYDRNQLAQDCEHHNAAYPFDDQHRNLKAEFAVSQNCKRMGLGSAMKRVGIPMEGKHHRGIDDARNIARLLPFIVA